MSGTEITELGEGQQSVLSLTVGGGEVKSMDNQKMAQYSNTNLNINVYCVSEVHGFLDGDQTDPASLLVLQYQLGDTSDRRFTAFRPSVTFAAADEQDDTDKEPVVTDCVYPGIATTAFYELKADASEEWSKSISAELAGPDPSPLKMALALSKVNSEHWTKPYKYMIKARLSERDPGRRNKDDQIRWEAWQETRARVGIDVIQVAMVVRRHPGYNLRVTLGFEADVDFRYKVGEKWDRYLKRHGLERTYVFRVYDGTEMNRDGEEQPKLRGTKIPEGVDRNHLREMENKSRAVFQALGWAHVVEPQSPKKYYIGEDPPKDYHVESPPSEHQAGARAALGL